MTLPETSTTDCAAPIASSATRSGGGPRFILVETSRAGNIGAAARAMKTMGFSQLVLVRPRFAGAISDPEAVAFASGAQDILQAARIVDSIDEALEGCHFAAAVSARLREFSPPVLAPRALAEQRDRASYDSTALIFGNERFGLPNEIVEKCNVLINIPANPAYSSLNLAQAVQIVAYEFAQAGAVGSGRAGSPAGEKTGIDPADGSTDPGGNRIGPIGFRGQAAALEQTEAMYAHLEEALVAIGFLDPSSPKKLMPRLRRLFARTQLETEEVNILRGIARQILRGRNG